MPHMVRAEGERATVSLLHRPGILRQHVEVVGTIVVRIRVIAIVGDGAIVRIDSQPQERRLVCADAADTQCLAELVVLLDEVHRSREHAGRVTDLGQVMDDLHLVSLRSTQIAHD